MDTFGGHIQLSTLGDFDIGLGLVATAGLGVLDFGDDVHALEDLAEDDVLAIEPAVCTSRIGQCFQSFVTMVEPLEKRGLQLTRLQRW